jgi:glycosyltransferase involved in cell wall biosynthesis
MDTAREVPRISLICDYGEEGWASMDLCAEMLLRHLETEHAPHVRATRVRPVFRRRAGRLPVLGRRRWAFNADRLINRFWDYPRHLRRYASGFDLFHVCDHSYAQLLHDLPPERTGVFCHDLDAFRCILEPHREHRPRWFRIMTQRVLRGLQKAAVVFHSTLAVRHQILAHGLFDPERLVHAPYGVPPELQPHPVEIDRDVTVLAGGSLFLLHVGSCIQRKRMDVLLDVYAGARKVFPEVRLIKVGGPWSAVQRDQIAKLGIAGGIVQLTDLDRRVIAGLYRKAALVLMPSETEGFGLPVIEALACGARVLASDIPVLREVGGVAVTFCPVANPGAWIDAVCRLLACPDSASDRAARLAWAGRFSWTAHARTILEAYRRLLL